MTADSQDLKPLLLETDEEFRQLASKHHELEERLHELTEKHYLSGPEQVEETTLKKRKLQLKDKMEAIVRSYRETVEATQHELETESRVIAEQTARSLHAFVTATIAGSDSGIDDSGFCEQWQRPVNGCSGRLQPLLANIPDDFVYVEVPVSRENGLQDSFSDIGRPQGSLVQKFAKLS